MTSENTCLQCGATFAQNQGRGRKARFCSTRCRVASHRRARLPFRMTGVARWATASGKRPMQVNGLPASTTNPETWCEFGLVAGLPHGIMLGGGLGCWDFDHCLDSAGRIDPVISAIIETLPEPVWVEKSVSGSGLHYFVEAPEGRGRRSDGVEFYSRARFILVTGDYFRI